MRFLRNHLDQNRDQYRLRSYKAELSRLQNFCTRVLRQHAAVYKIKTDFISESVKPGLHPSYARGLDIVQRQVIKIKLMGRASLLARVAAWSTQQPSIREWARQKRQTILDLSEIHVRNVWDHVDIDKKDELPRDELEKVIRQLSGHSSSVIVHHEGDLETFLVQLSEMYAKLELDHNGNIMFDEFFAWWQKEQKERDDHWIRLYPLISFQSRCRGVIQRMQLNRIERTGVHQLQKLIDDEPIRGEGNSSGDESTVDYFNWVEVLLRYMQVFADRQGTRKRTNVIFQQIGKYREQLITGKDTDISEFEFPNGDIYTKNPDLEPIFPELLHQQGNVCRKVNTMRSTLHHWSQMLMCLDENESGKLSPFELRASLMAFSAMGLISELTESVPMGPTFTRQTTFKLPKGGFEQSYLEQAGLKSASQIKTRTELQDFPMRFNDGDVTLLGHEGIDLLRPTKSWAIRVEIQFDRGHTNDTIDLQFNVLISSYRNNAIVACFSEHMNIDGIEVSRSGFKLMFVPREVFDNAAQTLEMMTRVSQAGMNDMTPWIELEEQKWITLQFVGERLSVADNEEKDKFEYKTRIVTRIDNSDELRAAQETQSSAKNSKHYDDSVQQHEPKYQFAWEGMVDLKDVYSLGNVFDNVCSDAADDIEWSLGPLRNFEIFGLHRGWMTAGCFQFPMTADKWDGFSAVSPRTQNRRDAHAVQEEKYLKRTDDTVPDLRYHLNKAVDDRSGICMANYKGDQVEAVRCKYKIVGIKRLKRLDKDHHPSQPLYDYVAFANRFVTDFEPGFAYSNDVVFRRDANFLANKQYRTGTLVKAMLSHVPPSVSSPGHATGQKKLRYWELDNKLELDSNTLFIMRGDTAKDDPGLNVLFTGKQLRSTILHMQRTVRVNVRKLKMVAAFFINPIPWVIHALRRGSSHKIEKNPGPVESILIRFRSDTGKNSDRGPLFAVTLFLW